MPSRLATEIVLSVMGAIAIALLVAAYGANILVTLVAGFAGGLIVFDFAKRLLDRFWRE